MAFNKCEECGARLTGKVSVCPGCGHSCHNTAKKYMEFALTGLVFAGAALWLWFYHLQGQKNVVDLALQQITGQAVPVYSEQNVQILEDRYRYYRIFLKRDAEITVAYEIKSGPAIDVFFLDAHNFDAWKRAISRHTEPECKYYDDLSFFGAEAGGKSHRIEPGAYYVVFDNTVWGPSKPPDNFKNDITRLDFKVTRKW